MDASCSSCGNTFRAEDSALTMCADCSSQTTPESESFDATTMNMKIQMQGIEGDGCMTFTDMEQALFGTIEGSKTVARTLTRLRLEGYQEDAWKVVLGLTAYAYKNLNCQSYSPEAMLRYLNQRPLREIVEYIPANVEELTDSVLNAEVVKESETLWSSDRARDAYMMGGFSLLALVFAFASRSR